MPKKSPEIELSIEQQLEKANKKLKALEKDLKFQTESVYWLRKSNDLLQKRAEDNESTMDILRETIRLSAQALGKPETRKIEKRCPGCVLKCHWLDKSKEQKLQNCVFLQQLHKGHTFTDGPLPEAIFNQASEGKYNLESDAEVFPLDLVSEHASRKVLN